MNASEFFTALTGLPGVRAVPVGGNGVTESKFVAGVEIARAGPADERQLRRAWRDHSRGGPDPLLLVADDPAEEGALRALGPLGGGGPVRLVGAEDLLRVVERLPALPRLQAVRTLAEELDQLDRTDVAGLVVRGLGTEYLLTQRLPAGPHWARLAELAEGVTGEWREVLTRLGYELEALPARGYVARANGQPVAVVRPVADPSAFAKLDAEGRPPVGLVVNECLRAGAPYGMLAAGGRLRLFEAQPSSGSSVARYLELDVAALGPEHRPLIALLAPESLGGGGFDAILREARDFGVAMRKRIDQAIRQSVLPPLGRELGRWAAAQGWELADDERRAELEAASLTFVFRALFLLYAESTGHLPVSFSQIVRDAAGDLDPRATSLWRRVQLSGGDLFARDGFESAEVLDQASVSDAALGPALAALGIDPDTGAGFDFSGLEIGHLGHIYEGLLSLRLSVADRDYRYDARADRYVAADQDEREIEQGELLWLTNEGGRKGGGVYYTPEALVRHLVRRGVVPPFERHLEQVGELARRDPAEAAKKLFDFHVLDPACGSAHFLVAVVDELADLVARFLAQTPLPAIRKELDDLRAGTGETYGVGVEDVALLRRLVLRRCVYGVDVSAMGAEVAKISLWLASFVPGLSLSYLDHNVRVGNSLIGAARSEEIDRGDGESPVIAGAFHWPLEFAEVFSSKGGFDAVVGNPPWEEVTVEELAFYARYRPGIRGMAQKQRETALSELRQERPELANRLASELERAAALRRFFAGETGYEAAPGDPDLYKFFSQRYRRLLRDGGTLAVVLPRTAFNAKGSHRFRQWLFDRTQIDRIDFAVNTRSWMFETSSRYTVALLVAQTGDRGTRSLEIAGVADSEPAFLAQGARRGVELSGDALGPLLEIPLLDSEAAARVFSKLRTGGAFPDGGGRWQCFPVAEFHETHDKDLWAGAGDGWPLWKGESFDQYSPHGAEARPCPATAEALRRARKPRPGSGSMLAARTTTDERAHAVAREVGSCRLVFRDVSRGTDPRTIRGCLAPPSTFFTNKAPYLAFLDDEPFSRLSCLALMNSLCFDWQARRFVEINVNFFILEGLRLPELDDETHERLARLAGRLSCCDDRFAEWADGAGIEWGPLADEERDELRAEIDAVVARSWGLDAEELEIVFSEFSLGTVSEDYRGMVRRYFRAAAPGSGRGWPRRSVKCSMTTSRSAAMTAL